MKTKKLITFEIDPKLNHMWKLIGITPEARESELANLEAALIETYHKFIENVDQQCEVYRSELLEAQEEFRKVQNSYGDSSFVLPIKPNLPFLEQISMTKNATEHIKQAYSSRYDKFVYVHQELNNLFDHLGIPDNERGEFKELDEMDLTESRLNRFQQQLSSLEKEYQKRQELFQSYYDSLEALKEELDEPLPDDVVQIFEEDLFDNESCQILNETLNTYHSIKDERSDEVTEMIDMIQYYYDILAIDPSDRITISHSLTQSNIDELEKEIHFLKETSVTRLPEVISSLNRSITKLCDELNVPFRQKPRLTKEITEESVVYLKSELEKLRQRQIVNEPILTLISQIEQQKDIVNSSGPPSTDRSYAKKSLEMEKQRKNAQKQIPKLEKKLYQMLVDYKNQTGQDFYFGEIKIIDTIDPSTFEVEEKSISFSSSKKLLLDRMSESISEDRDLIHKSKTPTRGKTLKRSTYTLSPFK